MSMYAQDYGRAKEDKRQNLSAGHVLENGSFVDRAWKDIKPGDVVEVRRDEFIPADIVVLWSSIPEGICFVETKNLDGETNLKVRQSVDATQIQGQNADFRGVIECDLPNNSLYTFTGNLSIKDAEKISLNPVNVLLRGCILRNPVSVRGVVVYAGHDSKVMMNATEPPSKRSRIEKSLDFIVAGMMLLLLVLCFVTAVGSGIWTAQLMESAWYLQPWNPAPEFNPSQGGAAGGYQFITSFILLGYLIPISLYVSLELVKVSREVFIYMCLYMLMNNCACRWGK
jgi:magnesium-transporting ATPase (P-type)